MDTQPMKQLSEFTTLAEAQAHEVISGQMIHRDSMNGWLGQAGVYKAMKAVAADELNPFSDVMEAFLDSEEYNFKQGTTTGDSHIALLDSLISGESTIGARLASIKPIVMARANVVSKPFEFTTQQDFDEAKDVGETITLPANTGQHKVSLTITTAPRKVTKLTIQQRFGDTAEDLTEWHDVASVSVLYKQSTYSSGMIPASNSLIRELRLISPLTLGVSKV
jgi:hypothetical protein